MIQRKKTWAFFWLATVSAASDARVRSCAGFRPPAIADQSTRAGGRRPKSAKAGNRGRWFCGGAAGSMGI